MDDTLLHLLGLNADTLFNYLKLFVVLYVLLYVALGVATIKVLWPRKGE